MRLTRKGVIALKSTPRAVTVQSAGDGSYLYGCYLSYNGELKYLSQQHFPFTVFSGDTLICRVRGYSSDKPGFVKIDGITVMKIKTSTAQNYNWQIPSNISTINVVFDYTRVSITEAYTSITITTA